MFARALDLARAFTYPHIALRHFADGSITSTLSAFIVLNRDGWVMTSAHVVNAVARTHAEIAAKRDRPAAGDRDVVHFAEIWALPGFETGRPSAAEAFVDPVRDLALVRLEPFDGSLIAGQPVFRVSPVEQGVSVCRLGFPFYGVASGYDPAHDRFELDELAFPVPRFALDGIVSRFRSQTGENGRTATFIETSTPGLRGQSGGPLLDVEGRVAGIQSHTVHLDLGFDARYERNGRSVVERQFINVGAATHVDEARAFLDERDVSYESG